MLRAALIATMGFALGAAQSTGTLRPHHSYYHLPIADPYSEPSVVTKFVYRTCFSIFPLPSQGWVVTGTTTIPYTFTTTRSSGPSGSMIESVATTRSSGQPVITISSVTTMRSSSQLLNTIDSVATTGSSSQLGNTIESVATYTTSSIQTSDLGVATIPIGSITTSITSDGRPTTRATLDIPTMSASNGSEESSVVSTSTSIPSQPSSISYVTLESISETRQSIRESTQSAIIPALTTRVQLVGGTSATTVIGGRTATYTSSNGQPSISVAGGYTTGFMAGGTTTTIIESATPTSTAVADAVIGQCPMYDARIFSTGDASGSQMLVSCGVTYVGTLVYSAFRRDVAHLREQRRAGPEDCMAECSAMTDCVAFSNTQDQCMLFSAVTGERASPDPAFSAIMINDEDDPDLPSESTTMSSSLSTPASSQDQPTISISTGPSSIPSNIGNPPFATSTSLIPASISTGSASTQSKSVNSLATSASLIPASVITSVFATTIVTTFRVTTQLPGQTTTAVLTTTVSSVITSTTSIKRTLTQSPPAPITETQPASTVLSISIATETLIYTTTPPPSTFTITTRLPGQTTSILYTITASASPSVITSTVERTITMSPLTISVTPSPPAASTVLSIITATTVYTTTAPGSTSYITTELPGQTTSIIIATTAPGAVSTITSLVERTVTPSPEISTLLSVSTETLLSTMILSGPTQTITTQLPGQDTPVIFTTTASAIISIVTSIVQHTVSISAEPATVVSTQLRNVTETATSLSIRYTKKTSPSYDRDANASQYLL